LDSNRPIEYIALCIAHEYAHLLLRKHIQIQYSIEQSLAILLQLSYEDYAGIRKFSKSNAEELMKIMNVWPQGKRLLNSWASYLKNPKKYSNILTYLKK